VAHRNTRPGSTPPTRQRNRQWQKPEADAGHDAGHPSTETQKDPTDTLKVDRQLGTEFAALLARADVSQAGFARLAGVTARQVNNWCRCRAAVPRWAAVLALLLAEITPEAVEIRLEEAMFAWHEVLGVAPNADVDTARRAMTCLARAYDPEAGANPLQMSRINAAYAAARDQTGP
jgi:DNA-binding transcriptional regulator YiaG